MAADVTPVYHLDTSWTTGYQAAISLENHDAAKLTGWVLEFDMSAQITSIWNAKVVSHSGNHYTIAGAAWDADLPGNGSVSFGFVASANSPATPTNYSVNGGSTSTPTPTVPKLSISNATVNEGDSGTTNAAFTVSLSAASTSAVSVAFNTSAGTATSGTDYTATSGTLAFAPGETSKVITVPVKGDTTVEGDETFYVNLVSATGATIDDNQAVGTITNDDVAPVLPGMSISDVTISEGNSGTSAARFTVSLSAASSSAATVVYNTSGGTASAGSDYTGTSGTLTFAPGETSKVITVSVAGDTSVENDETFYVNLVSATGATIDDNQAVGTIANDDVAPAPSGGFQFNVTSDWSSGFTGQIVVNNSSSAAVTDWQLAFDFAGSISSIWNAQVVSHSGNHYVVTNAGYNSTIAAGGSVSIGFVGSRANSSVVPSNFVLSGGSVPTDPTPTNGAPQAANDFGYSTPNQTITIDVLANDSDPDGDALSVSAVTQPAHGTVVINTNSTVNYTPASGFTGSDTFSYTVRDSAGATSTATVSITIAVPSESPQQMFAPYVDMGLWPTYDLVSTAQTTGLRYFSLAFIVAGPSNEPTWAGYSEYGLGTAYDTALGRRSRNCAPWAAT